MKQRHFRFPKAAPPTSRILLCICMCCLPVVVEVSTPVSVLVISVVVLSVSTGLPAARSLSLSTLHWPGHKTSVDVVVEEGGPRIGAKRRGGDPLPRGQCQSQFSTASGQQGGPLGGPLIGDHPRRPPLARPTPFTKRRRRVILRPSPLIPR